MRTKVLLCAVIIAILIAGCGGSPATQSATEVPPTVAPSATSPPTATFIPPSPTSTATPRVTSIIIDGDDGDWGHYQVLANDPPGDAPQGSPDVVEVRALINDQYMYVLLTLADPTITGKIDLGFETSGSNPPDYFISVWSHEGRNVYVSGIGGNAVPNDTITTAQGDVVEVRLPLALLENKPLRELTVQIDLGGSVGDTVYEIRPRVLSELEPTPIPGTQPEPNPTRFELTAEDGLPLVGYYYPSWQTNAPLILLVHQYGLNQEKWLEYGMVDWLQNWPPTGAAQGLFPAMPSDQSFAVLTVDLRGFGESGPPIPSNLSDEQAVAYGQAWIAQVKQVLAYAKTLPGVDSSRIAIIAANNGADASVAACGDCLGVLALSPGNYFYVDFKAAVEALDAQGKIVWCFSTTGSEGQDVATCASVSGAHYDTENFPGDGRGMQLIRDDKAPEGIGQNILDFLATVFGF